MEKLKTELKENNLAPCYLFFGEETYLKDAYEKKVTELFKDDISGDMNITVFDTDMNVNTFKDAVETLPFFAEKRLVLVKNSKLFKNDKKGDATTLAQYITEIPPSSHVVFIEDEIDKRGKLYKALDKNGRVIEFKTPDEKSLIKWAKNLVKKEGLTISDQVALVFFRHVGYSMENAETELLKLSAYKGKSGTILKEDVEALCTKSLEAKVFDLVENIGKRKTKEAVLIYHNMLMYKEPPIMILAMIIRQFRLMLQCKCLEKESRSLAEMSTILAQREFVLRQCLLQSKNFTLDTLKNSLKECLEADIAIKTGQIKDELAIELIIIKYSN